MECASGVGEEAAGCMRRRRRRRAPVVAPGTGQREAIERRGASAGKAISAIEIYSAIGGVTRLWKLWSLQTSAPAEEKIKKESVKSEKCASGEAARGRARRI